MTILRLQVDRIRSLLLDNRYFWILAVLVIASDAFLTGLIVRFIPCESFVSSVEQY